MTFEPELDFSSPDKPPFLVTRTTEEFMSVVEREKNGEISVEWFERVSRHNGWFSFKVRYE